MDDDATLVVDRGRPAPVDTDLTIGSLVNRRFVIEGVLGRGASTR